MRQKIGDPGPISTQNMFPLLPATPKRLELPYGAKYFFFAENPVFQFFPPIDPLLIPYWFESIVEPFLEILWKNRLVRYRGINNKGVLERPGTKWKVLKAISSTLIFQFTIKCWKVDFLMPCKTKSCQSSREKLSMLRALPPDTPRPPQFQPELPKKQFLWKTRFFQIH